MTKVGLSQQVEEGDYDGLVDMMGHLLAIKLRQKATDAMFEPLQETITLLKVYEQELPDVVYKQLEVRASVQSFQITFTRLYSSICFFQHRQNHFSYFYFASSICLFLFHPLPPVTPLPLIFLSSSLSPSPSSSNLSVHLQELPDKWNNVRKLAVSAKQQVAPLQVHEVASLRSNCASFDVAQHNFREDFRKNGPFW